MSLEASVVMRPRARVGHPLELHPSFRAVIAAAPVIAELARATGDNEIISRLALVCADLAQGFAAPQETRVRRDAHRRAWTAVREIERGIIAARIGRQAPMKLLKRAQRAIDRVDVLVSTLPGVMLE